MANIKYHLVQRVEPGVEGGGERKFYASIIHPERITIKELSEEIADGRTLTPTDVRAVLISLARKLPVHLLKGHIVELEDLGSFTVNLSSNGSTTAEDYNESFIRGLKIHFRPSADLKKNLKMAEYTKLNNDNAA